MTIPLHGDRNHCHKSQEADRDQGPANAVSLKSSETSH